MCDGDPYLRSGSGRTRSHYRWGAANTRALLVVIVAFVALSQETAGDAEPFPKGLDGIDVILQEVPETFLPLGGKDDIDVVVAAVINGKPGSRGKFVFKLSDVSHEAGYCLNAPADIPKNPNDEDSAGWKDLQFQPKPGYSLSADRQEIVKDQESDSATVVIRCFDYGAFGQVSAYVTIAGRRIDARVVRTGKLFARIPRDDNNNHIADCSKQNIGPEKSSAADDDNDPSPAGSEVGDRLSRYEEYRGFILLGKHVRTNPKQKDVFWSPILHSPLQTNYLLNYVPLGDLNEVERSKSRTAGVRRESGVAANQVAASDYHPVSWRLTLNEGSHQGRGQRVVKQSINPPNFSGAAAKSKRNHPFGETGPLDSRGRGFTNSVSRCFVYEDGEVYGIREGTKLATNLTPQTRDALELEVKTRIKWSEPGRLLIDAEIIEYATYKFVLRPRLSDGKLAFHARMEGLLRGRDGTIASPHSGGTPVPYFVNLTTAVQLVMAHELGHAMGMPDTPGCELMDQVLAGTPRSGRLVPPNAPPLVSRDAQRLFSVNALGGLQFLGWE